MFVPNATYFMLIADHYDQRIIQKIIHVGIVIVNQYSL